MNDTMDGAQEPVYRLIMKGLLRYVLLAIVGFATVGGFAVKSAASSTIADAVSVTAQNSRAILDRQCDQTGRLVKVDGITFACVNGFLYPGSATRFKALQAGSFDAVFVSSPGGSVAEGMMIGYRVSEADVPVVVSDRCLSSCANYIAPSGNRLLLLEQSFVGFHGTPPRDPKAIREAIILGHLRDADSRLFRVDQPEPKLEEIEALIDQSEALIKDEIGFFISIDIDEAWATRYNERNDEIRNQGPLICRTTANLYIIMGPQHAALYGVDTRGSWFPERRADFDRFIAKVPGYSYMYDLEQVPFQRHKSSILNTDTCRSDISNE